MERTESQTCAAVDEARRKFRAVLAPWAGDLLALRSRGLDRPSRRYGKGLVLRPAPPPAEAPDRAVTGRAA